MVLENNPTHPEGGYLKLQGVSKPKILNEEYELRLELQEGFFFFFFLGGGGSQIQRKG